MAEGTGRRRLWGLKLRRVPGSGPRGLESPSVIPSPSYSSPHGAVKLSEVLLVVPAVAGLGEVGRVVNHHRRHPRPYRSRAPKPASHPLRATRRPSPPRSGCSPLPRPSLHGRSASPRRTASPRASQRTLRCARGSGSPPPPPVRGASRRVTAACLRSRIGSVRRPLAGAHPRCAS